MLPRIGGHLSVGKGMVVTAKTAAKWGAETFQIFVRNPRGAAARAWGEDEVQGFRSIIAENGIDPVVVHIPYVVNPASEKEGLYELAERIISEDLARCDLIGARFLVLHPGHRGEGTLEQAVERVAKLLKKVMKAYKGNTVLLIETMAGMGKEIGADLQEIKAILDAAKISRDRLGVCIDSCHLLGAGHDIASAGGIEEFLKQFDQMIGVDRIRVMHINDSQREIGSHIDRHAPIGQGHIGKEGVTNLMRSPILQQLPFIIETEQVEEDIITLRTIRDQINAEQKRT